MALLQMASVDEAIRALVVRFFKILNRKTFLGQYWYIAPYRGKKIMKKVK